MLDVARHFEFQSTPPVKAATFCLEIRALTGAISIHAAREGGDQRRAPSPHGKMLFQSTPPVKAATASAFNRDPGLSISIHAAREGGDDIFVTRRECEEHFNPRRP